MTLLRLFGFVLILFSFQTFADQHLDTSRLIVTFHEKDYMELGGATEATDYINSRWGDKKMVSLMRPLGSSTILVELVEESIFSLNEVVDELSKMPKIFSVEKDLVVDSASDFETNIPSIQ